MSYLNKESMRRIENIANGFRNHPAYKDFDIMSYPYGFNIIGPNAHALEITKHGEFVNLWLFFPDNDGSIESIAVYGKFLDGHLNAIRRTMTVFGMPVSSVSKECGASEFVDIILA